MINFHHKISWHHPKLTYKIIVQKGHEQVWRKERKCMKISVKWSLKVETHALLALIIP